jgi:hypothetical protein
MAVRHRQDAVHGIEHRIYIWYVNIIKVPLFKVTSDTVIKSVYLSGQRFESVCWQQPLYVSNGCLTVWWPWDRSCFSVSRSQLWCTCTDLAFWMIAGGTGSGSGGCWPWWSLWPSCDIRCCRCPGGQVVCPRWRVVQTALPSGVALPGGVVSLTQLYGMLFYQIDYVTFDWLRDWIKPCNN